MVPLCQHLCEVWLWAFASTEAGHVCKLWLLNATSTKAWMAQLCQHLYKVWLSATTSIRSSNAASRFATFDFRRRLRSELGSSNAASIFTEISVWLAFWPELAWSSATSAVAKPDLESRLCPFRFGCIPSRFKGVRLSWGVGVVLRSGWLLSGFEWKKQVQLRCRLFLSSILFNCGRFSWIFMGFSPKLPPNMAHDGPRETPSPKRHLLVAFGGLGGFEEDWNLLKRNGQPWKVL